MVCKPYRSAGNLRGNLVFGNHLLLVTDRGYWLLLFGGNLARTCPEIPDGKACMTTSINMYNGVIQ